MKGNKAARILGLIFLVLGLAHCAASITMGVLRSYAQQSAALHILMLVFGSVGVPFLLTGVIVHLAVRREEKKENLKYTGTPIRAKILGAERNQTMAVNGRVPYRLLCSREEDGTIYLYRSENLWYDPRPFLKANEVTIYRDPSNHKRYYVDTSEVLAPVEEV